VRQEPKMSWLRRRGAAARTGRNCEMTQLVHRFSSVRLGSAFKQTESIFKIILSLNESACELLVRYSISSLVIRLDKKGEISKLFFTNIVVLAPLDLYLTK
jgi:hypothetical protein